MLAKQDRPSNNHNMINTSSATLKISSLSRPPFCTPAILILIKDMISTNIHVSSLIDCCVIVFLSELLTYQLYKLDLETDQRTETNQIHQKHLPSNSNALVVSVVYFLFVCLYPRGVVGGDGHFDLGELSRDEMAGVTPGITSPC